MRRPRGSLHRERKSVRVFSNRRRRYDSGVGLAQHLRRLFFRQKKLKSSRKAETALVPEGAKGRGTRKGEGQEGSTVRCAGSRDYSVQRGGENLL